MKRAVLNLLTSAGAFAPFRKANRHQALVVMYHRFSEGEDSASISVPTFRKHLEYLKSRYTLVTIAQLAAILRTYEALPPSLAAITIDDGFRDAYELAFPLLVRYSAPATVFVVSDFIDQKAWIWTDKPRFLTSQTALERFEATIGGQRLSFNLNGPASRLDAAARMNVVLKQLDNSDKEDAIRNIASALRVTIPDLPPPQYGPLTWTQAREMESKGVEIASHTLTHPILTNVGDEQLRHELEGSRLRLEDELGHESTSFCYPNGNHDARVLHEAERAGYRCAVTTDQGLNSKDTNPFSLQRIPAVADFARFVKSTSGFEQVQAKFRTPTIS